MEPSHRAEILQDGGEKNGELRFFRISCLLNFSHFWGDGNPSEIGRESLNFFPAYSAGKINKIGKICCLCCSCESCPIEPSIYWGL